MGCEPMFSGDLHFLSNFSPFQASFDGYTYATAEHAYQAAKSLDPMVRDAVATARTPGAAKRLGRTLELRPDWEQHKFSIMRLLLASKFTSTTGLAWRLVQTGDLRLVETNYWHDQIWGDCYCDRHAGTPGRNELGLALMDLRSYFRKWQ
jgi:ribA/ribD-fused uncharacterized protein